MAIRYPTTANEWAAYTETFGGGNVTGATILSDTTRCRWDPSVAAFVAPSRYSEVRKVIFWCTVRHEHLSSQTSDLFKMKISPARQTAGGVIDSFEIPESTATNITALLAKPGFDADDEYGDGDEFNQEIPLAIGATTTNGYSCLLYQEYHRFTSNAGSVAFFDEWDSVAATANDDLYTLYRPHIQRLGGTFAIGTGSNSHPPVIANFGMVVVQTGAANNKICTYLGTGRPFIETTNDLGITFSTNTLEAGFWNYDSTEWDGITKVNLFMIQPYRTAGNNNGGIEHRVEKVTVDTSGPNTQVSTEEALGTTTTSNLTHIFRSKDLWPELQGEDGSNLVVNIRSTHATTNGDRPLIYFEITQKQATKSVTRFQSQGHQYLGAQISPTEVGRSGSIFNPDWFEDFDEERVLKSLALISMLHGSGTNDPNMINTINANLDENPATSSFNVNLDPDLDCTPCATAGYKLRRGALDVDPRLLVNRRALFVSFRGTIWLSGSPVRPGWAGIEYVLDLPDSETLDVGPVFELDAFNPEGCASTAAGLGDDPGVLAITNGSLPPKKFNPVSGLISNLGIQPPFTDEVPSYVTNDTVSSPLGGLDLGDYIYRYTFRNSCTGKESDPNPDDIEVDTSMQSPAASVTFSFAGIRIPDDPQIDQICIYRTSEGGAFPVLAKVGCFDFSVTTVFTDDTSDDALDFTNEPLSVLNGPAPCAPIVAEFRNRLFLMGDIPQLSPEGTVSVEEGSDIMTFSTDAEVDRCFIGRFIQVEGDCKQYEIDKILPSVLNSPENPRVQLLTEYEGSTNSGLKFTICGRPNRVYVSEPLEPDYWPAANFIDVEPGDGDRIMGAISNFNGLVICKRRKTYVLRFTLSPATEVIVPARVSSDIGCIGPRTFAQIENGSVWLADRGIALFDGRGVQHIPESDKVNDLLINPDNPRYVRRDRNGRVIGAIGVFYPKRQQYLLLLPTVQTDRGANLMMVWDTTLHNVTFYEFCQEFTAMEVAKDADGNERVYLGDEKGFVWIFDIGDTDGVGLPNATGTVRGSVDSAGVDENGASFLTDTGASFLRGGLPGAAGLSGVAGFSGFTGTEGMGLAGACVFVRRRDADKDDPWVSRTIFAATQTTLYVSPSWGDEEPDSDYEYMIGPIEFVAEFKPKNYDTDDMQKRSWAQIITHVPESVASKLRIELIPDFQLSDPDEDAFIDPVTDTTGQGRVYRMDWPTGRQIAPLGRMIHNFMQVRMSNFAPEEPIQILNHHMRITPKESR